MNTETPTNDEWIVTDNENYIEIASTQTRDSIASVHGGKTVGEQYDLAGRIAKVPQLERELTAMTEQRDEAREQRDGLHELHNKNAARSQELLELCRTLRKELTAMTEQRDEWKQKFIQQNKDLGCEQMDPDGTIWDYASKVQTDLSSMTEQRDRLAEALYPFSQIMGGHTFLRYEYVKKATEALQSLNQPTEP